ncbi:hypothetical protein RUM43_015118, partial [Polyplax serrata]
MISPNPFLSQPDFLPPIYLRLLERGDPPPRGSLRASCPGWTSLAGARWQSDPSSLDDSPLGEHFFALARVVFPSSVHIFLLAFPLIALTYTGDAVLLSVTTFSKQWRSRYPTALALVARPPGASSEGGYTYYA